MKNQKKKHRLLSREELRNLPAHEWLVHGILHRGVLAVLYGAPGIGKSFVALDLALSIQEGLPWQGCEVKQGPIVYVAAENGRALSTRISAWETARGIKETASRFLVRPVELLDPEDVTRFIEALTALPDSPVLIVLDTLSRCIAGEEENGAATMSGVVQATDTIREATGAAVLLIHHTSKKGTEERGHNSLRGGAEAMFLLKGPNKKGMLELVSKKSNNSEPFTSIALKRVVVGDSCVIEASDPDRKTGNTKAAETPPDKEAPLPERQVRLLEVLRDSFPDSGAPDELVKRSGIPRATLDRYMKALEAKGYVAKEDRRWRITSAGKQRLAA